MNVIFSTSSFVPLCKSLDGIKVGQVPIHVTSVGSVVYDVDNKEGARWARRTKTGKQHQTQISLAENGSDWLD